MHLLYDTSFLPVEKNESVLYLKQIIPVLLPSSSLRRLLAWHRVHRAPDPANPFIHHLAESVHGPQGLVLWQRVPRVERQSLPQGIQIVRVNILPRDRDRRHLDIGRLLLRPLDHQVLDLHVVALLALDQEPELDGFGQQGALDRRVQIVVLRVVSRQGVLLVTDGFDRVLDRLAVGPQAELGGRNRVVLHLQRVRDLAGTQTRGVDRALEAEREWDRQLGERPAADLLHQVQIRPAVVRHEHGCIDQQKVLCLGVLVRLQDLGPRNIEQLDCKPAAVLVVVLLVRVARRVGEADQGLVDFARDKDTFRQVGGDVVVDAELSLDNPRGLGVDVAARVAGMVMAADAGLDRVRGLGRDLGLVFLETFAKLLVHGGVGDVLRGGRHGSDGSVVVVVVVVVMVGGAEAKL